MLWRGSDFWLKLGDGNLVEVFPGYLFTTLQEIHKRLKAYFHTYVDQIR